MELGLEGRVAIVTGSSQGIGRAIAEALGRERARVAVTYRHDRDRARAVVEAIRCSGSEAIEVFLDLSSVDSIREAADTVIARWQGVDVLVNNAIQWGTHRISNAPPFEQLPPDEWQQLMRTNIEGVYATVQAVLPSMRERRWGRIVSMSTVIAHDGMSGGAWYSTVKSALHGLTRSLAREVGVDGILANVVMPGPTLTVRALEVSPPALLEAYAAASPIGRLPRPEEIAAAVTFLCSAANTTITGEVIRTSGGFTQPHQPRSAARRS